MPFVQMNSITRHRLRLWLTLFVILALLMWLTIGVTTCIRVERERDPRGRVASREEWPEKLLEFLQDADQRGVPLSNLKVYYGLHDDFFWKCDATPELVKLMIDRWKLTQVTSDHRMFPIVFKSMPTAISSLQRDNDIDYYVSAEYLPGGEWSGHLYCVMNYKTEKQVVVRYYYNF